MNRPFAVPPLLLVLSVFGAGAGAEPAPVSTRAGSAAPGMIGRVMPSGQALYLNDHVATGDNGRLQVMLLDQTVFTLGPNSDMVLDEFVYHAGRGSGRIAARITKGVFRFTTGMIARRRPSDMRVALEFGTIGVRGTIVAGQTGKDGSLVVLLGSGGASEAEERRGAVSVENAGASVLITRRGYGTRITGARKPPSRPALVPREQMEALLASLSERPPRGEEGGDDDDDAPETALADSR